MLRIFFFAPSTLAHLERERERSCTEINSIVVWDFLFFLFFFLANPASLFFCVGVFSLTATFNIVLFSGAEERGPGVWNMTAINYIYYIEFNCFFFLISLWYKNNTFQAIHSLDETRKTSCWVCDPVFRGWERGGGSTWLLELRFSSL